MKPIRLNPSLALLIGLTAGLGLASPLIDIPTHPDQHTLPPVSLDQVSLDQSTPDDFTVRVADRTAIEQVYYHHRLGHKPPFEQTLPPTQIEALVRLDLQKEAALKQVYGVEITPVMIEAEIHRINTSTRAPEILADLKAALGQNSSRFGRAVARPILVERELCRRFETDDALHRPQRQRMETVRHQLLAGRDPARGVTLAQFRQRAPAPVQEVTWQLTPRPATDKPPTPILPTVPTQGTASSRSYAVQDTVQVAQVIATPEREERTFYFEELHPELQSVLRAQLQQAGDLSAVIETPHEFLLYLAQEKTATTLKVASVSLAKLGLEVWLASRSGSDPSRTGESHP